jgi:hypothetical protein
MLQYFSMSLQSTKAQLQILRNLAVIKLNSKEQQKKRGVYVSAAAETKNEGFILKTSYWQVNAEWEGEQEQIL